MTATPAVVEIVPYQPAHAAAFRDFNLEWIAEQFGVEPEDERVLGDPQGSILDHGGTILIALLDGVPVGTVSLIPRHGMVELSKMAVTARARGLGIGRRLAEAILAEARRQGFRRIDLFSQTELRPALALYRSLGFVDIPLGENPYLRADVRMRLEL